MIPQTDRILHKDKDGDLCKTDFHCRSSIRRVNYLTSSTRPGTQFAMHQCSKFSINPKYTHKVAAKHIFCYLKCTADEDILVTPNIDKGFKCYVNTNFAGTFTHMEAEDPSSCLSQTGYVIMCTNCPILWSSKMQSIITLLRTEAEYVALSTALRDVIYILQLINNEISQLQQANTGTT